MVWFRCFIRGENFPGEFFPGQLGLVGFYVTRFVKARTVKEAQENAMKLLKKTIVNPPGYKPSDVTKVFFEEIVEVPADQVPETEPALWIAPMDTF